MEVLLWLALGWPLVAALLVRFLPWRQGVFAIASATGSAAISIAILVLAADGRLAHTSLEWLPGADLEVGLILDPLAAVMSATVALVSLAVMIYAAGYFQAEPRRRSGAAGLLLFVGFMQGLVLADGYLTMLIFWELVGALSARLIAFSRTADSPAASVRAFLTTRAADAGFYLAVAALFAAGSGLGFGGERPVGAFGTVVALGLILAAMGKSAQVPLQGWLSAAMAGPTPVSALLHSATMVAAGVYLIVRSQSLLAGWPLEVVGWVGAVTAVAGALIAFAQTDLKRVLAGSTSSQLGLMLVGAAVAGPAVAIFQLVVHAGGKAVLFLAAGCFQRSRGSTDLGDLAGVGRQSRTAFAGFAISALSIAAVPPFAAFWSKEHIAAATEEANTAWFVLVLAATVGSSAYLLRPALILWNPSSQRPRSGAAAGGRSMLVGLGLILPISLAGGALGGLLATLLGPPELPSSRVSLVLSIAAVLAGAGIALRWRSASGALIDGARRGFHLDGLLEALVQRPVARLAALADRFDRRGIDAAVDGVGTVALLTARSQDRVERLGIDAAVDGIAASVRSGGRRVRRAQSGQLFEYLRLAVLGGVALVVLLALTALL